METTSNEAVTEADASRSRERPFQAPAHDRGAHPRGIGGLRSPRSFFPRGPGWTVQRRLVGEWTGAISAGGQTLRLILNVDVAVSGSLRATLTSVDQGNTVIQVDTIAIEEDAVSFSIASIDGSYEGTMNADGSAIDGTWSQLGQGLPLALERSADP